MLIPLIRVLEWTTTSPGKYHWLTHPNPVSLFCFSDYSFSFLTCLLVSLPCFLRLSFRAFLYHSFFPLTASFTSLLHQAVAFLCRLFLLLPTTLCATSISANLNSFHAFSMSSLTRTFISGGDHCLQMKLKGLFDKCSSSSLQLLLTQTVTRIRSALKRMIFVSI